MLNILNKVFDPNKREIKRLEKIADQVEALADETAALSDEQLRASLKSVIKLGKPLMICLSRLLRLRVKGQSVLWAYILTVFKSWVGHPFMMEISPR
jgi:hypothetical protein